MEFISHGVHSPKVWSDYLANVVKDKSSISEVSFRDKRKGWKQFSLKIKTSKEEINETLRENLFLKGFLQDIYLRPSCYSCSSKKFTSGGDITVGDCWGIQYDLPEIDDDKGVSCIFINSKKGEAIYKKSENLYSFAIRRAKNREIQSSFIQECH